MNAKAKIAELESEKISFAFEGEKGERLTQAKSSSDTRY